MAGQSGEVVEQRRPGSMSTKDLRAVRGGQISMIFREPTTALNPVLPVGMQIDENLRAHTMLSRAEQLTARVS